MSGLPDTVTIMRSHAVRIMALAAMLKGSELEIRRNAFRRDTDAEDAIIEVAEECALQLGGLAGAKDDDLG